MASEQDFAELENALFRAGKVIAYPPTRPLAAQVRATLEAQARTLGRRDETGRAPQRPRMWSLPRWSLPARVALATAIALLLALAVLLVSPETREAVAQFFGLRTIKIIYVTPTPQIITATPGPTPTPKSSAMCCETTLQNARQRAQFELLLPPNEQPSKVYFQEIYDGEQVVLVFGDPQTPTFTLYEAQFWIYQKVLSSGGFGKQLSPGTIIHETQVRGRPAIWFSGAPHVLVTLDSSGVPIVGSERPVNANTLAWESGDDDQAVTYRLETGLDEASAKRFAESLVSVRNFTPTATRTPTAGSTPSLTPTPGAIVQCCETTLQEARRRARFKLLLPPDETPTKVYFQESFITAEAQQAIFVFGDPKQPRYVLYEAQNYVYGKILTVIQKEVDTGTLINETTVKGQRALWLSGAPHILVYLDSFGNLQVDTQRTVSMNTLDWESSDNEFGATYRLETNLSEPDAIRLAESLQ